MHGSSQSSTAGRDVQLTRLAAGGIGLARRLAQLKSLKSADLVVLERELFPKLPGFLENYLLKRAQDPTASNSMTLFIFHRDEKRNIHNFCEMPPL